MNHSIRPTARLRQAAATRQAGFTLLEVTFALFLFGALMAGVFKVASACFQVANTVTEKSQREMHAAAFFGLLRQNFTAMPGNGKITMELPNSLGSAGYQSEIVLKDYPLAFSWGGVPAGSERVLIVSEKDPIGGLQVRIRYLNEEEAEAHENDSLAPDEGQSLVLIAGIKSMRWEFYDQTEEEWLEEWDEEGRRPSLVTLFIEFYNLSEEIRAVFWIPVVANPESVVRGAQTSRGVGGSRPTVRPPGDGGTPTIQRPGGSGGGDRPGGSTVRPPGGSTPRPSPRSGR